MGKREDQLEADEDEDDRQAHRQVDELAQQSLEQEVERPQTQQGRGVGREDEIGLLGDPEGGRNRVQGEEQVRGGDGHHDEQKRRGHALAVHADEELGVVIVRRDRVPATHRAHDKVVLGLRINIAVAEELDPGPDEDRAEDDEGEGERRECRGANGNEDRAQDQGEHDTEEKYALVIDAGYGELGQDDDEDEEVVDRQGLLHQVGREVLRAEVTALPRPDEHPEGHRHRDVEDRPQRRLLEGHVVRLATHREEVHHDEGEDGTDRDEPHRERDAQGTLPG